MSVHGQSSMCKILESACLFIFTAMLELMHIMLFKARRNQANAYVAVPCRNQRLFRCVFRSCCCIQSTVSLNSTHIHTSTKHIWAPLLSSAIQCFECSDVIKMCDGITLQMSTRDCHKQYFNLCHLHDSWMPCLKMAPWLYAVTVILLHYCTSRNRWMKVSLKAFCWDYMWLRQHLECSCTCCYLLLICCILSTTIRHLATAWAES